ncbi:unnamed protein product [Trichobilharzia regenti]|nr:unnamed protein product [Trichobilharzia regenti]
MVDCAMSYFIAVNFIGGLMVNDSYELDGCRQLALEDLTCEGERPFKLTKSLSLLWLCKRLCRKMSSISQTLCIYLHQYLIGDERSPKLKSEFHEIIDVCVLGKCTRFQEKEVANLTVKVSRLLEVNDDEKSCNDALPQELCNQFSRTSPPLLDRSVGSFFLSRMPSIWTLQIEQGRLLMKIGCYKSALDSFLLWDKWSEIIECYTHLNKREKAEEVIRSRLNAGDESADLYCALGDVTNDRQYYLKAWDVSNHKSARAMRSLAVVYMYTDKAGIWFTFGCCCLQAKEYVKAEKAFRACVRLEADDEMRILDSTASHHPPIKV